tara:strand:+ start:643 stop:810 length:168 start_codon:yes stop_codon:yes gene_type:complete
MSIESASVCITDLAISIMFLLTVNKRLMIVIDRDYKYYLINMGFIINAVSELGLN